MTSIPDADARARIQTHARQILLRLIEASARHAALPLPQPWPANARVGRLQTDAAQRELGVVFPLDLSVSYEAVPDGAVPLCGWHWWSLDEVKLQTRMLRTIAALRAETATPRTDELPDPAAADRVKLAAWHHGWIPVAESAAHPRYLLCVDTAPADENDWGQLIEVRDPTYRAVDLQREPPRPIASSWLSYWQRLALALETQPAPEAVAAWKAQPSERLEIEGLNLPEMQADLAPVRPQAPSTAPRTDERFDLGRLLPADAASAGHRATHARELRATRVLTGDEAVSTVEHGFGDATDARSWLGSLVERQSSTLALLVGCHGDGLTTLVMEQVERLASRHREAAGHPVPLYLDLALLVDHAAGIAPATLAEALALELVRRGLPGDAGPVLQGVSDGRCALFIDHAESVAIHHAERFWQWPAELPHASDRSGGHRARVTILCADEYFDSNREVADVVEALRLCRSGRQDVLWYATLTPMHPDAASAWCAEAGFDLANRHDHLHAWRILGDGRATAARTVALRPLFTPPEAPAPREPEVFAAWWKHCVPTALGLDVDTLRWMATSLALTELQQPSGGFSVEQFALLVQHRWPEATPQANALLRMHLRIALQLRWNGDLLTFDAGRLWSALAVLEALDSGELDVLAVAIAPGPRGTGVAQEAARMWLREGPGAPPLARALQEGQPPEVAAALFRLAAQWTQEAAAQDARADMRADRTKDFDACHAARLEEALALACPLPLSLARVSKATLNGANLRDLPLEDLDLSGADLSGADFTGARLSRVSLDDAVADDACFDRAVLVDVSAERLVARRSRWHHARWNRRWPHAQLTDATSTVPGVRPDTADGPYELVTTPGASPRPLRRLLRSPDGRWIAALTDDGSVGVWHGDTLAPAWHLPAGSASGLEVLTAAFSHDGSRLITSHAHKALRSWSTAEGRLLHEAQEVPVPIELLVVHPGGQYVVGYSGHRHLWYSGELKVLTGLPATVPAGSTQGVSCAAMRLPRGGSLFVCTPCSHDGIWEYRANEPRRLLGWPVKESWQMATARDADTGHDWLAVLDFDALWLGDPDSAAPPRRFERPGATVPTFRPPPHSPRSLVAPRSKAELAFSPDGRWLVCLGSGGPALLISTRDGSVHGFDAALDDGARCATFDAAGRLVLGGDGLRVGSLPELPARR